MEKELNIAAILKEKPAGTKLWSPIFGNCVFSRLSGSGIRVSPIHNGFTSTEEKSFFVTGQYTLAGEVCLFPSKEMRDWSKFFKKGDVLVDKDGDVHVIFEGFTDNAYTSFKGKHYLWKECDDPYSKEESELITSLFEKANDDEAQTYINTIEERFGGKLNRETLEIEKPEFKDGDIVVAEEDNYYDKVIFIAAIKDTIVSKVLINVRYEDYEVHYNEYRFGHNRSLRLATENEQQQLFSALEKEGKRWNPVTKQIEDLPKKCEFKPFDKVLARGNDVETWIATLFGFYDKVFGNYVCIGHVFEQCIPYNEETKHLLGTTNEWKGGK